MRFLFGTRFWRSRRTVLSLFSLIFAVAAAASSITGGATGGTGGGSANRATGSSAPAGTGPGPVITRAVAHDTSPALRTMKPAPQAEASTEISQIPLHVVP